MLNNSFLYLRWQGLKVHICWSFFVFLIRKWANLIGLCLMDDSLLCLMTDLWPFIGTTRSSMGIFLFLLYGRPECINDFWRNLEKISKRIKTHMWYFMYSCIYTNHCCKSFCFNRILPWAGPELTLSHYHHFDFSTFNSGEIEYFRSKRFFVGLNSSNQIFQTYCMLHVADWIFG